MTDAATFISTVLDALGPTNRIARALVNRLELAEDKQAEAEAITDELDDIWAVMTNITVRTGEAFERGIARLEAEACRCGHPVSRHWHETGNCMVTSEDDAWACECTEVTRP
jgi:hypothetical protein